MKKIRELKLKFFAIALGVASAFIPLQLAWCSPPVVEIQSPSGSVTVLKGEPVTLNGRAVDAAIGNIPDDRLVWSSDLDGPLGKGASIKVNLSNGNHLISLTASNDNGEVAQATVAVKINVP